MVDGKPLFVVLALFTTLGVVQYSRLSQPNPDLNNQWKLGAHLQSGASTFQSLQTLLVTPRLSSNQETDLINIGSEWELIATCEAGVKVPTSSCHPITECGPVGGPCLGHILVTGGAGFIGSHTVLKLLSAGYAVTVVDNLANASPQSIQRIQEMVSNPLQVQLVLMDLRDRSGLLRVFRECGKFDAVIHFAGLKAVGESGMKPIEYYSNNVAGTVTLLEVMEIVSVDTIIFSSSATVYGTSASPLRENASTGIGITNPYGQTKYMIEKILEDTKMSSDRNANNTKQTADNTKQTTNNTKKTTDNTKKTTDNTRQSVAWKVVTLRYFNPVGASETGKIGEQPNGVPNNIMPYVSQVATGKLAKLTVYGTDYPTADGSGERDYIHVDDLAEGHVAALKHIVTLKAPVLKVYNLGSGKASSVFALIAAFKSVCRCPLNYVNGTRRPGDLAQLYADPTKANVELGWKTHRSLEMMCRDTWHWVSKGNQFRNCNVTGGP